jgi:hypothetical protein
MQLPAYQINNALLDFKPLNEGVDAYRQGTENVRRFGVAQDAGNALMKGDYKGAMGTALAGDRADLAGLAMHAQTAAQSAQEHAMNMQLKETERLGRIAEAAAEDPNPQNRAAAHQYLISRHPKKDSLDPIYLNPDTGLNLMAAEAGKHKSKLEQELMRAQINRLNAQAGAQTALANVRDGRSAPEAPDPLKGWGMDEDGNMIPPRGPAIPRQPNALFGPATAPDAAPADAPQAAMSPTVGAGRFSPGATKVADKRTAEDDAADIKGFADDGAQQRLQSALQRRRALEAAFGKPPTGKAWNDQGGLVDLSVKDTATERAMRMHAASGQQAIIEAEKLLNDKGVLSQLAGDTYSVPGTGMKVGGFGEAGRGFRAAESAVLQLNFALSGKSVSNAERQEFQRLYMPSALDSRETQKWKIGQIKQFFQTVLDARKKGMDDDRVAELYRQAIAEAAKGAPEQPAQPRQVDPKVKQLYNKYWLE